MKNAGIITQARMTSTRLPGKVLMKVRAKPLLEYHLERLSKSGLQVIVATTTNQSDDPIAELCNSRNLACFRGDELNVLSRYYYAAIENKLDVIVRVTSDCPLVDGELIKSSVAKYLDAGDDWLYASNSLKRTFPRGFDFEIFSLTMLKEAFSKATLTYEIEHVTPYFYQNKHSQTHLLSIEKPVDDSGFRLTVDEPDDFKLIEKLITDYRCDLMNVDQICELLNKHPELKQINAHVEQKKL